MIIFFDRNIGVKIPRALKKLGPPIQIEYHQEHFDQDEKDDVWLPIVGKKQWTVIGHDRKFHKNYNELEALKQYNIGCFCLWGSDAPKWDKIKVFFKAFDRIVAAEANTPKPFIYHVKRSGRLEQIHLS